MRRLRNARSGDAPILDKGLSSMLAWGSWGGGCTARQGEKRALEPSEGRPPCQMATYLFPASLVLGIHDACY